MSKLSFVAFALTVATLAAFGSTNAHAQGAYPDRQIRIVVPVAPGGLADMLARAVGQQLGQELKQQVLIENKPGGNFQIGIKEVLAAPADGYTLLVAQEGAIVLNPHLYSTLSYDPLKDLAPISGIAKVDQVLIVHPSVPARDGKELIAYAKSRSGELSFGTFGPGSTPQLYMEMLHDMAGVQFVPVTYRGAAPIMQDLISGQIDLSCPEAGQTLPQYRAGSIKAFGVLTRKRWFAAPDVPTLDESGLPGVEMPFWHGMWAPKGTPQPVIDKLNAEVVKALADPLVRQRIVDGAGEPATMALKDIEPFMQAEITKWAEVVKRAGIKVE